MSIHPIEALKRAFAAIGKAFAAIVRFIGQVFTEADGNGGKASFARVFGAYVIIKIVLLIEAAPFEYRSSAVPEQLMTMFWVLVGYSIISKILGTLSPAVLDIFRAMLLKAGAKVEIPQPEPVKAQGA